MNEGSTTGEKYRWMKGAQRVESSVRNVHEVDILVSAGKDCIIKCVAAESAAYNAASCNFLSNVHKTK